MVLLGSRFEIEIRYVFEDIRFRFKFLLINYKVIFICVFYIEERMWLGKKKERKVKEVIGVIIRRGLDVEEEIEGKIDWRFSVG